MDSPAWHALYPAAVASFSPFAPSKSKGNSYLKVALRVRGAPASVPVLSHDGSQVLLTARPV
nr:hypothetical protein [Candidatus Sigynarchaeota archaeon]